MLKRNFENPKRLLFVNAHGHVRTVTIIPSKGVPGGPAISPRSLVYELSTSSTLHFNCYSEIYVKILFS